jgi:glycosyltransferase involved in cell wall biosynthesis
MTAPDVSIVVCTYNRCDQLERALTDLTGQATRNSSVEFEIVVVNDASTDATDKVIERIARTSRVPVRGIWADGTGVAHARNVGLSAAAGRWIAFFDDDQRTNDQWLLSLWTAATAGIAEFVGGPVEVILPGGASLGPVCRAVYGEHPTGRQRSRNTVPLPAGGNRLVKRTVFDRIGMHDESLPSGEDLDLVSRAEAARCRFGWASTAVVWHQIAVERLSPDAIKIYCEQAGAVRAQVEHKRWGSPGLVGRVALRAGKMAANAGLYLWARSTGSALVELDCRARFWLTRGYVRRSLRLIAPRLSRSQDKGRFRDLPR